MSGTTKYIARRGAGQRNWQRGAALGVLLGWFVSICLGALALEGILRLAGFRPIVVINEPDRELGWTKRRNESTRKVTSEFDITFAINSLGLRGDPGMTRAKPAGTKRVLFLGDSFVLGYTVDPSDHFVDLVGRALSAEGRAVEALNGGTEGYSTDQEVLWLRKDGLALEPDVVVACFFQNDVFGNGQSSFGGIPKPRFSIDGRVEPAPDVTPPQRGWMATHTAIGALPETLIGKVAVNQMPPDEVVALRDPPPGAAIPDCWARTEACFRELKKSCDEKGVKLLLVAIPTREEVEPGALDAWCTKSDTSRENIDPRSPAQKALDLARKSDIAVLDPLPALTAAAKDGAKVYFETDWHVNPAGSRVLAGELLRALSTDPFLGAGPVEKGLAAIGAAPPAKSARWPFVLAAVWLLLGTLYAKTNRDEPAWAAFLQVALMIGAATGIVLGLGALVGALGPTTGRFVGIGLLGGFVLYLLTKMANKLSIIREVYGAFLRRGHWYMIPLIIAMLSIGGLLVVASSSPFIAPFIYTLF
ncbi:MAG: hypothetical protein EXS13_08670 [Planctomycetes bacterium]|nr:hypothetical protein [Planctomycetota bacterium]